MCTALQIVAPPEAVAAAMDELHPSVQQSADTSHAPSSHTLHQCVCLQIVALEEADVAGMDEPHVMRLASSLLPDSWLSTPRRVRLSLRSAQQSLIS